MEAQAAQKPPAHPPPAATLPLPPPPPLPPSPSGEEDKGQAPCHGTRGWGRAGARCPPPPQPPACILGHGAALPHPIPGALLHPWGVTQPPGHTLPRRPPAPARHQPDNKARNGRSWRGDPASAWGARWGQAWGCPDCGVRYRQWGRGSSGGRRRALQLPAGFARGCRAPPGFSARGHHGKCGPGRGQPRRHLVRGWGGRGCEACGL